MRHLFIVGAAVVAALGINAGNAEAASAPLDGLATSGLPTIDVRYYRRYPSYYRGRHSSYTSSHCANRDEIRESTAHVARNQLAAKHQVLSLSLSSR